MELTNRDYHEKRNFIRMKVHTPVAIRAPHRALNNGICHNLSGGGLLISLTEALPLGTEVEVTICSRHGHNPMLRAQALVQRLHLDQDGGSSTCQMGLRITHLLE